MKGKPIRLDDDDSGNLTTGKLPSNRPFACDVLNFPERLLVTTDEIAVAIESLGIEMDVSSIMKKWDTDLSGTLDRAEFISMMLEILDPASGKSYRCVQGHTSATEFNTDFTDQIPKWEIVWTAKEDETLNMLVEVSGTADWSSIAKHFPDRTDEQCRQHWSKELDPEVNKDCMCCGAGDGTSSQHIWKPEVEYTEGCVVKYGGGAVTEFEANHFCPLNFYGLDFDWLPWGHRTCALGRAQIDLGGTSGFGGFPFLDRYLQDEGSVEIEVPRMRWMLLNQNPANLGKFNSYLAESLLLYTTIYGQLSLSAYQLASQHPRTIGSASAIVWLSGRLAYLFSRARASVHVHATGVPPPSLTAPHKASFPVELKKANSLVAEFLSIKG